MELKDVILSTLAEMEEDIELTPIKEEQNKTPLEKVKIVAKEIQELEVSNSDSTESEMLYLNSIRERLLVLFEGFQAPNNTNIEAKVDMTLNFLEYTLATIDSRIQTLEKGDKQ